MRPAGASVRAFLLGAVAAVVAGAAVATLVVASGVVDVAATAAGGVQDRVLAYASRRAIAHHAKDVPNPLARDPKALAAGLRHYRAMCVDCHGGPGAVPEEFAAGLHPAPPDLASAQVQSFTDGMLYEVIARGIGSTGMPAFGSTHSPEQLWSLVAFVRHLPALTPEEREALGRAEHHEEGHDEHGAEAPSPAGASGGTGATAGEPAGRVHRVSITNFEFAPPTLRVHPGDVVEWENADFAAHTATAADGSFDTGAIRAGATARVVVKEKGRREYRCRYHAAMKATVVVE